MVSKWQKYVAIGVMVLVVVLIGIKLIYNYNANQLNWEEEDAAQLTNDCLDDLGGYAVRYPGQSITYCECSTEAIIQNVDKAEYYIIREKSAAEQEEELLPIILECYNAYQEAIYNASTLD